MFQIQKMFENGTPDIVLKTVKSFNIKRTPIIILIFKMGGVLVLELMSPEKGGVVKIMLGIKRTHKKHTKRILKVWIIVL